MRRPGIIVPAAHCIVALLCLAGCNQRPKDERVDVKTALLPEVSPDDKNPSNYQPAKPYAKAAENLLARTVFQADAAAGYRVEVRDWKLPGGKQSGATTLPGAAFIEVRSGAGAVQIGDKKQELQLGAIVSVSQDQSFTITSNGPGPLTLRMYVVLTP